MNFLSASSNFAVMWMLSCPMPPLVLDHSEVGAMYITYT